MGKRLVNIHIEDEFESGDLGLAAKAAPRWRVMFYFDDGEKVTVIFGVGYQVEEVIISLRALIDVLGRFKNVGDTSRRRLAPWNDYRGNCLFEGDTIIHPDGESGKILFKDGPGLCDADKWFVDYGPEFKVLSRLCLQIGRSGMAVKKFQAKDGGF